LEDGDDFEDVIDGIPLGRAFCSDRNRIPNRQPIVTMGSAASMIFWRLVGSGSRLSSAFA
jgi:hypothetical protein